MAIIAISQINYKVLPKFPTTTASPRRTGDPVATEPGAKFVSNQDSNRAIRSKETY